MATAQQTLERGSASASRPFLQRATKSSLKFMRRYPLGAVGLFFVIVLIAMAAVPQAFTPLEAQDPLKQNILSRLEGPSGTNWLGTDDLGRDVWSRIVYGARTSIIIGFGTVIVAKTLSTAIGTVSGYYAGWFDSVFQRIIDIGSALPGLVFLILAVTVLAPRMPDVLFIQSDILAIIISVSVLNAVNSSRTVRSVALSLREEQYVDAARSLGASNLRIMVRHIVPNLFSIVLVSASLLVGSSVLLESSLSFLGYGVQPPAPSWGRMLNEAREFLTRAPHLAIFPGLLIFVTVWSFNMLGDALRDKLDPRLRGSN